MTSKSWQVFKFGGTSVSSASNYLKCARIGEGLIVRHTSAFILPMVVDDFPISTLY